ncbi:cyclin-dependent kinase inhibitor 4 isoform X2 [Capsella rubella]|uniref:cyclin-dependent kinase inhibitor 4 isoform X2 n=1 Tax=Capsella rubella TaxID=81985 RepID=UPI000CD5B5D6|nr:cyclin-dependent kinase inhibitor 4 isoform X2 [Capsella rubella]
MGKYIKKSKIDGGGGSEPSIALMDVVSPSSSLGVLTRAKSLALQQQQRRLLQNPSSSSSSSPPTTSKQKKNQSQKQQQMNDCTGGSSYLQLRSRRLQKKPPIVVLRSTKRRKPQQRKETCGRNPNPQILDSICGDGSRTTRESTPCSLIRKPEIITTPGSSTKLNICISESNQREDSLSRSHLHLPTTPEMDEFFSGAEEEQQKQFIEKYNFDPVNEQPLPGRFEWTKVDD